MESQFSLKDVVVSMVKPARYIEHPATVEAGVFDLITIDAYVPLVFFYKPHEHTAHQHSLSSKLVEHFKESLSEVLVAFFPFAGRWVKTYDANIRSLQCTDVGVPFIEAFIDEELENMVNFDDFVAKEILGGFQLVGLDPTVFNQDVDFPLPPLFVQVTEFNCGGVALHMTFSHQTTDGQGMMTFMSAWSQISVDGKTNIVPTHDRSAIMSLREILEFYGARVILEGEIDEDTEVIPGDDGALSGKVDTGAPLMLPQQEPMSQKTLHVKRELIQALKETNAGSTTVDFIIAHVWRSLNNLPTTILRKNSTAVGIWVDGRKRFQDPPLPEHYCGNAVVLAFTPPISVKEMSSNSLLFAAKIVHDTVRAITPSTWLSSMVDLFYFLENYEDLDYQQINITSWLHFPMYEIKFGVGLGKPVFACLNITNRFLPLGVVVILPPRPGLRFDAIATIQLIVQTNNGAAQALAVDAEFLSFFH